MKKIFLSLIFLLLIPGISPSRANTDQPNLQALKEAIGKNPNDAATHFNLGMFYEKLERREDAISEFEKVIRIFSSAEPINLSSSDIELKSNTHLKLGGLYYKLGQWEKAVAERDKANEFGYRIPIATKTDDPLERWREALVGYTLNTRQTLLITIILPVLLFLSIYLLKKAVRSGLNFKQKQPAVYRPDIDGLRAVAILSVVAFHAKWPWAPGGFAGVDVFFVISGYLISGILFKNLESGSFSFFDFYSRRIKRIFPALITVLFAVWGAGWFVLLADEYKSLGKHLFSSAAFLQNFTLWLEAGYFDTASDLKPLLHLWSLGVEEQYYILWPLLLYFCWQRKINALLLLCLVGSASFALNVGQIGNHAIAAFYLPHTRFWELMLGGVLAYSEVYKNHRDGALNIIDNFKNLKACLGFSLILAAVLFLDKSKAYPGWWALIPIAGAFLSISGGREAWINRNILANPLMVFIGLISYPLYLWHWPLLSMLRNELPSPPWAFEIAAIALAFVLSWLTYEYLEKPVRFGKFSKVTRATPAVLAIFVVGAGLLGVETYKREGFTSRFSFPGVVQYLTNYPGYSSDRNERCLGMGYKTVPITIESDCIDPDNNTQKKPLVLLWGDSTAAHLYPGLKHLQSTQSFRLAQFTAPGCPPLLFRSQTDNGNRFGDPCHRFNNYVSNELITQMRPITVILSGNWTAYDKDVIDKQLNETVTAIKKSGINKIILSGPSPTWNPSLPRALFYFFKNDPLHRLPNRMRYGLNPTIRLIELQDKLLHKKADRLGIIYVSPFNVLCNEEGCLTRVGNNPEDLLIWDYIHFTPSGSRYFINSAFSKLPLT